MLKPGTNDQSQSDFRYHADDTLRMWDGYDHPELAEQTELVEKLSNGNFRHLPITREQMAAIMIALKWSLHDIEDFELKEKDERD
jgi:hypothetical protein